MDENEIKKAVADGIQDGIKSALAALPPIDDGQKGLVVVKDEGDREFRSIAEQAKAVKAFELSKGKNTHPRLAALAAKAASGASEGVPSDGGYLLEPTLAAEVMKPIHQEGPFTSAARRLPVSANSNYGWINGVNSLAPFSSN